MFRISAAIFISLILVFAALPHPSPSKCRWRGSYPLCAGRCYAGEDLVAIDARGDGLQCVVGQKALCCPNRQCIWRGRPPFCYGTCEPDELPALYDRTGPAGSESCLIGKKSLCCKAVDSAGF